MSECNYWWRAGNAQWCDMKSDECKCGGWEEHCDMRGSGRKRHHELDAEMTEEEITLAGKKKAKHHRHRAA